MARIVKPPVAEPDDSVESETDEAEEFDLTWLGETQTPKDMGDPKMIGLYGPPGHGKTWLGASACMVEGYYPLLLIDTEGSANGTVAKFPDDRIVIKEVKTVAEFDALIVNLINKKHPFKTVMVDTLGNQLDRKEWEIMRNPPKTVGGAEDTQKAWGMLYNYAKKLIDGLRSADFKTIIVFHEKEEKDKIGNTFSRIWINGAAKKYIPSKPDLFGLVYCETDDDTGKEERTLYLGADTGRATKTRFSDIGLPTKITDPSMKKIIGIIRDKLNETKED